jgi:plasmid stabilization system protein ParE
VELEYIMEILLRNIKTLLEATHDGAKLGSPGRVPGTRELVIPKTPYIVHYCVSGTRIEIARVYHTSHRWPDRL